MRKFPASVSHRACEIQELKEDRELAVEYLKQAVECLSNPGEQVGGLLAVSALHEAYSDLGSLAVEAGVESDPFYQVLPTTGIPVFETATEYQSWIGDLIAKYGSLPAKASS
jgi:hypothetical protein